MFNRTLLNFLKYSKRCNCTFTWKIPQHPEFNIDFVCNPKNEAAIHENIVRRKGVGKIKLINELKKKLDKSLPNTPEYDHLRSEFFGELLHLPNQTHPDIVNYGDKPKLIKLVNEQKQFTSKCWEFSEIVKLLNMARTDQLGNVAGNRSYYLLGELAMLEQALVNYFIDELCKSGYEPISVPDILPRNIIERCGMNTKGDRTQVYTLDSKLHQPDMCLSGTSEMALAGYLAGETFSEEDLPKKLAAVSRCYRAETSSTSEERGIFRVHEFTKVEMFMVTTPDLSDEALEEIRSWEEDKFNSLDMHFQILDMPPNELGPQAYRKYDIEAWMPGRKMYGEISSCSNCTDYQSRRLDIKYISKSGEKKFVHTLNGTACAVPRLLIALTENGQDKGFINLPRVLHKYMNGKTSISRLKSIPKLQLVKNKK